jgi:hypothetical protein
LPYVYAPAVVVVLELVLLVVELVVEVEVEVEVEVVEDVVIVLPNRSCPNIFCTPPILLKSALTGKST